MANIVTKTDVGIQRDVLDELSFDPQVAVNDIGVAVDEGVVTLTGEAQSFSEKYAAERAALRVAGVRPVANELALRTPFTRTDTDMAKDILDAFMRITLFPWSIEVRVAHGSATLEGTVHWQFQRTAAEDAARKVRGVEWVSNLIRVVQPPVDKDEITNGIKQSLVRNAAVDADHVHVAADGGHVTLTGAVRSWAEREEAQHAAWRAKGVMEGTNGIVIQPR